MFDEERYPEGVEEDEEFEYLGGTKSPWTTVAKDKDKLEKAREMHEDRPKDIRQWDENENSEIAKFEKWKKKPAKYDYPGVDTVSKERRRSRGNILLRTAEKSGLVSEYRDEAEVDEFGTYEWGRFDPHPFGEHEVRINEKTYDNRFPGKSPGPIKTQEFAHSLDYREDNFEPTSEEVLDSMSESEREEIRDMSERLRGSWEEADSTHRDYREGSEELVADVITSMIQEPEAAQEKAPQTLEIIEEELGIQVR